MDELKQQLIEEATIKHEKIYPVGRREGFEECFTVHEDKLVFWFNREDQSTSILTKQISN